MSVTAAVPTVKCEIAFATDATADPGIAGTAWQDVSEYFRGADVSAGRQRDLSRIEAGNATITLDNTDRRFDPKYTGGAYYPNIKINRHIRLMAGYLAEVLLDKPTLWWRFGDGGTATAAFEEIQVGSGIDWGGVYNGGYVLTGASYLRGRTCVDLNGTTGYVSIDDHVLGYIELGTKFTIAFWMNPDAIAAAGLVVRRNAGDADPGVYNVRLTAGGEIEYLSDTGATVTTAGANITAGGGWYHVMVTYDSSLGTKCAIYINGVLKGSGNPATPGTDTSKDVLVGRRGTGGFFDGQIADLQITKGTALSATRALAHYTEGAKGLSDGHLFRGFVDGWPQSYPAKGKKALVITPCTDAFKLWANLDLPSSVWALEVDDVLNSGSHSFVTPPQYVVSWWRLGDPQGTTQPVDSSIHAYVGRVAGSPNFGQSGLAYAEKDGAATFPTASDYISLPVEALIKTASHCTEFIMQRQGNPSAVQVILDQNNGSDNQVRITLTTGGLIQFTCVVTGLLFTSTTGSFTVTDGKAHHIACHRTGTNPGTIKIYVDGVERGSTAMNNTTAQTATKGVIGGPFDGVLDEVLLLDDAPVDGSISAASILEHSGWAISPWEGMRTDEVVTRLLDWSGWSNKLRDISTGATVCQRVDLDDKLLETLQRVGDTENGLLYIGPDGKLVFRSRDFFATENTVRTAFGDDDGDTEIPYEDPFQLDFDETYLYNIAHVGRQGGTVREVLDTVSGTAHGWRSFDRTNLLSDNDEEMIDYGNWVVDQNADPHVDARSVKVMPVGFDPAWPHVLMRRFGEKATITRRPFEAAGSAIVVTVRFQGVTHTITPAVAWTTSWQFSNADDDQPWILGDAVYGVLGTTTKLGA